MLALRLFFWPPDWDDGGAPPTPVVVEDTLSYGGGGGHKKRKDYDYPITDETFWLLRERYLRRMALEQLPPLIKLPPAFKPSYLPRYKAELEAALLIAAKAETRQQLRATLFRVKQLEAVISAAKKARAQHRRSRLLQLTALAAAIIILLS